MASIYKRKDGHGRPSQRWTIAYTDAKGERRTVSGFKDRRATEEKARKLEQRAERIKAGLPVADEENIRRPLSELVSRWLDQMRHDGAGEQHREQCRTYVTRMILDGGMATLADVTLDRFNDWIVRASRALDWSDRTANCHVQRCKTFIRFCVLRGWLQTNPLANATTIRRPKPRRKRRAFTIDELRRLLAAAPAKASLVYFVASTSGLRRGELRELEVRDVDLGPPPRWRLRAEVTKAKRADVIPMLPECAAVVAKVIEGREPVAKVFRRVPKIKTLYRHMAKAGLERIGRDGRRLDFHSLRYTFCTELAKRLPIQRVRQLMRHATIQLTLNLYADLGIDDLWDEVQALPSILGPG